MPKRAVYHVLPRNGGWGCKLNGEWIAVSNCATLLTKETYVRAVKALARSQWKERGIPTEVIVHVRRKKAKLGSASRIGKGHGSRSTYGNDPKRHKG